MKSNSRRKRILLGVTGSVATVKVPELVVSLVREGNADLKLLLTKGAMNFWPKAEHYNKSAWDEFQSLILNDTSVGDTEGEDRRVQLLHSEDEWRQWNQLGDPVMHIDLRNWADILLIAPLSAHTLAKLSNGLCDDVLTSVARAWDFSSPSSSICKAVVLAPAMNTFMWNHPLTKRQLEIIKSFGDNIFVLEPQVKELACGDVGKGALTEVSVIVDFVKGLFL